MQVFKVHHAGTHDLGPDMVKIPGLVVQFEVTAKSRVFITGSVGIQHRKLPIKGIGDDYAIGIGARLEHTGPDDVGRWIKGSKWGPNIVNGKHHYVIIPLSGYIEVVPGNHEISFWATAHTDVKGHYPYLAEIQGADNSDDPGGTDDPYNQMIVTVLTIA